MKWSLLCNLRLALSVASAWVLAPRATRICRRRRRPAAPALCTTAGPTDFFGLYDDDELWKVLNIHQQLQQSKNENEVPPVVNGGASMHETILKSYGEETMENLLDLHESLKQVSNKEEENLQRLQALRESLSAKRKDETTIPSSLHDLVQQAVGEIKADTSSATEAFATTSEKLWDAGMDKRIANIRAIASDVDGTLLTSQHTLHPRSRQAVRRAVLESDKKFFLATGKTRKGALGSLGVEMKALLESVPGVYVQGLYCIDADGKVIFEKKLTKSAVAAVERLANENNISLVAYDGDSLFSPELTKLVVDLAGRYGEPTVTELSIPLAEYKPGIHKVLLMDENVDMLTNVIRPMLEALARENNACVTQAVPTMLEWLPEGCSKAHGVAKLCEALNIDPSTELLAIGDAENDVGMLEMAAIGVAVGNACPHAKDAADFLMEETNDEGGAGSAMELFGFGSENL